MYYEAILGPYLSPDAGAGRASAGGRVSGLSPMKGALPPGASLQLSYT